VAWDLEREIINAGYRHLSKKAHPDHGGNAAEMIRLNEARARLNMVCSHGLDVLFPAGASVPMPAAPAAPPEVVIRPQRSSQPATPTEVFQYLRQQIESDPLGAAFLNFTERWIQKRAKPRKGAGRSRRTR
jgi:hypothetical protein